MPRKPTQRLAYSTHPLIEAILGGHYRFARKSDAQATLDRLAEIFLCDRARHTLWIEGFALSGDEAAEGYKGHFARIAILRPQGMATYTLTATRESRPLSRHPKRTRPSYAHPDGRHPLLRAIRAGRLYETADDALLVLAALHEDFPRATIPGQAKLHIALYEKPASRESDASRITRYLLTIEPTEDGQFRILATPKPPSKRRPSPRSTAAPVPQGRFTARESLKRRRRP